MTIHCEAPFCGRPLGYRKWITAVLPPPDWSVIFAVPVTPLDTLDKILTCPTEACRLWAAMRSSELGQDMEWIRHQDRMMRGLCGPRQMVTCRLCGADVGTHPAGCPEEYRR